MQCKYHVQMRVFGQKGTLAALSGRTMKSYVEHSNECTSIHKTKMLRSWRCPVGQGSLTWSTPENALPSTNQKLYTVLRPTRHRNPPIPPMPVAKASRVPDRNECVTFPLSTLATDPVMSPVPPTGFILCKRWLEYLNECKV